VTNHDDSQAAPQADAGLLSSIPAMPTWARADLSIYRRSPYLLLYSDVRRSIGWQDDRKAGPSFVVARFGPLGRVTVKERFPFTEQGWVSAWRALAGVDPNAAAAIRAELARSERNRRSAASIAALDAESLGYLRRMTFNGGSGAVGLAKGQDYDARFLDNRLMVCPPGSTDVIFEMPYREVEAVEVSGAGEGTNSAAYPVAWGLALGLLGALLGLLVFGLKGLFFGALIFGLVGAVVGAAFTNIKTIVRIRGTEAELYFLSTAERPDALRIELSEALRAIANARDAPPSDSDKPAEPASVSISDELGKLASLLQQDLITRDEFEQLKAKLIAES